MDKDVPLPVDPALLPRDPEVLAQLIAQLISEPRKRDGRIQDLEHRMDLLLRRVNGRTSEKLDPAQLSLFDRLPEERVTHAYTGRRSVQRRFQPSDQAMR